MDIEDIKLMKDPDCYARMRLGIGLCPWQEKILRAMEESFVRAEQDKGR